MSTFDSDDLGTPGYFLPEDSQFQLKKLRDHMTFLSRLAQPRTWNEQDHPLEVPVDEIATCLELLAEQVTQVLDEVAWPAQRRIEASGISEKDVVAAEPPELSDAATKDLSFGLTLDQFDTLDRLIQTISAYGDVVACSYVAGLADRTLPQVGQAIYEQVEAVRAILHEVEAQPLGQRIDRRTGLGEERATYRINYPAQLAAPAGWAGIPTTSH